MARRSPYEGEPKVVTATSMVGVVRLVGLLVAVDRGDTVALTAQSLCPLEATKHTSGLVPSSLSFQDVLRV